MGKRQSEQESSDSQENQLAGRPRRSRSYLVLLMAWASAMVVTVASCSTSSTTDCTTDTFRVTTTEDVYDAICDEHCSLREAIDASNTCRAHPQYRIDLPAGTYTLALRGPDANRGDLDILRNTSIVGVGETTIIEGPSSWNNRILHVNGGATLNLEDLRVRGGRIDEEGAGILNEGILTLTEVSLVENDGMLGGGLFNLGTATIVRSRLAANQARWRPDLASAYFAANPEMAEGFPNQCGGAVANLGTVEIVQTDVEQNQAEYGGGLCNGTGAVMRVSGNSRIRRNYSSVGFSKGGGAFNWGNLTIQDSTISRNRTAGGGGSTRGRGGGIAHEGGFLSLDGVSITDNGEPEAFRTNIGGGLFISADFSIENSVILDNIALAGGGFYLESGSGNIEGTSIARNQAEQGGGLYIYGAGDRGREVTIVDTTISGNTARASGGPAYVTRGSGLERSLIRIFHTTVALNSPTNAQTWGGIVTKGGRVATGNSLLVGNGFRSCLPGGSFFELEGNDVCDEDASAHILTTLTEDNGQWLHPLLPSSDAVDAIPVSECGDEDQRGMTRPQGDDCDVGAYEFEPIVLSAEEPLTLATSTPTPQAESSPPPPVINTDTLCWKGPGPLYEVISSVLAGTEVVLQGRGLEGDWWIIENPRFEGVTCWVRGQDLELSPLLDLSNLPLIKAPPPPTPTPTPIAGCLYQGANDPQAMCYPIDSCPVPFDQSQGACTP